MAPENTTNAPLKAIIQTIPKPTENQIVYLTGDEVMVHVYSQYSQGDIIEYRIDTDITFDSNGDGNPENDIDNQGKPSFHTGELFSFPLQRVQGDKTMQLIIVSSQGKGSRIQRRFIWQTNIELKEQQEFRLFSDKLEVSTGEVIHFGIEGVGDKEGYEIKWDFNGDKATDYVSSENLASYIYTDAGEYEVFVQIKHQGNKILKYQKKTIIVTENPEGKNAQPFVNFSFERQKNRVEFTNESLPNEALSEGELLYAWKFGDGFTSSEKNPRHIYRQVGDFIVRLIVTDARGVSALKQEKVRIEEVDDSIVSLPQGGTPDTENPVDIDIEQPVSDPTQILDPENPEVSDSSDVSRSLVWTLFLILIFLIFGVGALLVAYLVYLKVQSPDFTFMELLEEEKEKILSFIEGREYEPPHEEIVSPRKEIQEAAQGILSAEEESIVIEESEPEEIDSPFSEESIDPVPETVEKKLEMNEEDIFSGEKSLELPEEQEIHEGTDPMEPDHPLPPNPPEHVPNIPQEDNTSPGEESVEASKDEDGELPDWLK